MNPKLKRVELAPAQKASSLLKTGALNLPAPRLQFTWIPILDDWSVKACVYTLVLKLGEYDIRREGPDYKKVRSEWHCEIGLTHSEGGRGKPVDGGIVDSPFRDGAHALWDSAQLGCIPIYAVCENTATKLQTIKEVA